MRRFLATRHSLRVEAASVSILYVAYEATRGLIAVGLENEDDPAWCGRHRAAGRAWEHGIEQR